MVGRRVLGLAVGATQVTAALVDGTALTWAGHATYSTLPELVDVIGRLAGEAGRPVQRVRVALTRELVQVRTVQPPPPLKPRDVPKYVRLEVGRLFRKNGVPLVTDGALIRVTKTERALWASAAPEPLLAAILDGCTQAGMKVEAVAPSADTLPSALEVPPGTTEIDLPNGRMSETLSVGIGGVWKSRRGREVKHLTGVWVSALSAVNGESGAVGPAYAAAIRLPTLSLFPEGHRLAQTRTTRRRLGLIAAAGVTLWLLAGGAYVGRLSVTYARATTLLHAFRGAADSALDARRNLDEGRATLATIAAARLHRSRTLAFLGALTHALPDSVTMMAVQVGADGTVRVTGHAPRAAQVVAALSRMPGLSGVTLDGAVTREVVPTLGERDRFTIVARESRP